jgi:DHA1 family bicyclomycin/chloramphenicol resistance-like MFS transporter
LAGTSLGITLLLGTLFALVPLGVDAFLPAMPAIAEALAAEPRTVQFALTTFLAGGALGQLFWGPFSDRFGRRPALLAGLAVALAASVACALAASASAIVWLRLLQGLGMSAGPVIARAVARDLFAHEQAARLLARMTIVFGLVPILAPLAGAALLGIGWQAVFWLYAAVAAALAVVVRARLAETAPRPGAARAAASPYRELLRDRRFVAPVAVLLASQFGVVSFISSSAFVMVQAYGVSPQGFAALFSLAMLGHISGAWLSSRVVLKHGIARLVRTGVNIGGLGGVAVAALVWSGVPHWAAVVGPMFVYMFGIGFVFPSAIAAALSPFPHIAGSASALLGALQFGTSAATSALLALAFDGTGRPMAAAVAAGALAALAAERWILRRRPAPQAT